MTFIIIIVKILKFFKGKKWGAHRANSGQLIHGGQLAVVQYLISAGANKEAKNDLGCTPLALASQNGKLDVVQYLISVGANNETKTESGSTPLIHASINGHLDVVQYLISVGANKKAMNNYGKTALMVAKGDVWDYLKAICAN